ncbi:hypothetical protein AXF14_08570 [Actinomyces radicidentis]|uniref:Uncharacterized protein n=1 Tax=Actinomyces radicidentis TaxID=111015 RepID=A0A0X8JFE8_ACTRD|nr:hypothetical protein [Actinomyces radicidentis]AMD87629.1 hypothetical protein AXF14_08570 [Actinomyces radicidentis]
MEDVWRTALADRSRSIGLKGVLQQPGVTWTVGDPVADVQAPSALIAREGAPVTGDLVLPVTHSLAPGTPQTYVALTWGPDAGWVVTDHQEIDADAS